MPGLLIFWLVLNLYLVLHHSLAMASLKSCDVISKILAVTVTCHVIPASGRLGDVDIPELSESPCHHGFDIF